MLESAAADALEAELLADVAALATFAVVLEDIPPLAAAIANEEARVVDGEEMAEGRVVRVVCLELEADLASVGLVTTAAALEVALCDDVGVV